MCPKPDFLEFTRCYRNAILLVMEAYNFNISDDVHLNNLYRYIAKKKSWETFKIAVKMVALHRAVEFSTNPNLQLSRTRQDTLNYIRSLVKEGMLRYPHACPRTATMIEDMFAGHPCEKLLIKCYVKKYEDTRN